MDDQNSYRSFATGLKRSSSATPPIGRFWWSRWQELMVIVPENAALEIEAMLANKEKGFVREGHELRVKLGISVHPLRHAVRVVNVSNDAVPLRNTANMSDAVGETAGPLVFPMRIALDQSSIAADGQRVTLMPGLSVGADVKTGSKRVLEFCSTY